MKKVYVILIFTAIAAAAAVGGCTSPFSSSQPTPVPTVYGPIPSATPTPAPAGQADTAVPNSISSTNVTLFFSPLNYKVVDDAKTRDGRQYENITLYVENDGSATAKNVVLTVTVDDMHTGARLVDHQEFPVGDLDRGDVKLTNLMTSVHTPSYIIKLSVQVRWGDNGEYYNPTTFPLTGYNTFSFPL